MHKGREMTDTNKNESEVELNKISRQLELNALADWKLWFQNEPENSKRYEKKLLETFRLEFDLNCEYFYSNTFWGDDEKDYLLVREIFDGRKWSEIDFDILYNIYIQHLYLDEAGFNYYLPAFLKYFYNLRHSNLLFFDYVIGDLAVGCVSTRHRIGEDGKSYLVPTDYSAFERFTPDQAKLIAAFLMHVATLNDSDEAQKALKNYWGKFLLL
jgi:hypothetical protein